MPMPNDLFSKNAAKDYVGVTRQAVEQRVAKRGYEYRIVHGKPFIARAWLDEWKAERGTRNRETISEAELAK